jgi:putative transposase
MPRANRYFIPGTIWHITQRCHKRSFLLKFAKDRRRWLKWLFQAKKKYGLRILNYVLTSNHVHLLVMDGPRPGAISASMDLVSGRVAQEFNKRKKRHGAFWQDRYHATAVEDGVHLRNCMVYIDLNMVRAGVVDHPSDWPHCGYNEICSVRQRHSLIHWPSLLCVINVRNREELRYVYPTWIEDGMKRWGLERDSRWTESVAVGGKEFVEEAVKVLGARVRSRNITGFGEGSASQSDSIPIEFILRERTRAYRSIFTPQKRFPRKIKSNKSDLSC